MVYRQQILHDYHCVHTHIIKNTTNVHIEESSPYHEIIESCNNLCYLLKSFSVYGLWGNYGSHKGSQTCLIGDLHVVTGKFYH